MAYTILVTAPSLAPAGLELLRGRGCDVQFVENFSAIDRLTEKFAHIPIDAVISRTMQITEAMMASCPTLKVISKHGVGVSNIDLKAATNLGIAVFSTPGANTRAVSEFTIGLLIASFRHVARFDRAVRAHQWTRAGDGGELAGRTLGLIGFGRIAREVARVASALQMRILAFDPYVDANAARPDGVEFAKSIGEMLPHCHALSLHCPAQRGMPPIINAEALALLPQGAVIVNTARGELIDEAALVQALRSGRLGAAALDTFATEPLEPDSPLLSLDNVILTPHVAGSTPDALAEMARGAVTNILNYLDAQEDVSRSGIDAPEHSLLRELPELRGDPTAEQQAKPYERAIAKDMGLG